MRLRSSQTLPLNDNVLPDSGARLFWRKARAGGGEATAALSRDASRACRVRVQLRALFDPAADQSLRPT